MFATSPHRWMWSCATCLAVLLLFSLALRAAQETDLRPNQLNNSERDILEFAERHPLAEGGGKYVDPALATAVERLSDIPRPWTVPRILTQFKECQSSWATHDQQTEAFERYQRYRQRAGDLARVLASSGDPRAALALGRAMESPNFPGRGPATRALFDYFVRDVNYGLPPPQHATNFTGNLLVLINPAAQRWFLMNTERLEAEARLAGTQAPSP